MTPIIIFKEKNKNGKLEFTEDELKKLLVDAYNNGLEEGKRQCNYYPLNYGLTWSGDYKTIPTTTISDKAITTTTGDV